MRRTLKELGIDITDAMMLGIVMAKLPPRYHHVRDVLEMTEDLTYDALKERMRVIYRRDLTSGRRPNEVLMTQHASPRSSRYMHQPTLRIMGACSSYRKTLAEGALGSWTVAGTASGGQVAFR